MWRPVFLGAVVALAACREAEAPLPRADARIEAHPRTPFGQVRRAIYDFTSARHPGIRLELRDQGSAGSARAELYGRHLTEPLEQLVVVHVANEEILIDDIAATDAASLADKARVTVVEQDHPGAGYEGAMCVSTQSFPAHAGARPYRLRMRFSD